MRFIIIAAVLIPLSACASPLADRRVSNQWAMDVCAEMDRDQWRACMRQGLTEAPAASVNRVYPARTCPRGGECINRLASRQCPNGANDYNAYRDARGRLHVDAGCD